MDKKHIVGTVEEHRFKRCGRSRCSMTGNSLARERGANTMTAEGLREKAREWLDEHVPLQFAGSSTEPVGVTHIDKESMSDLMAEFAQEQRIVAIEEAERAVREKRAEATKWQLCAFADGYLGALESTETLLASLRSELGSGPEGEER